MNKRIKVIFGASVIVFIIVNTIFTIHIFKKSSLYEESTGKYSYKISTSTANNQKMFKWDVSISKEEIKRGIIENQKYSAILNRFRTTLENIKKDKVNVFFESTYLIFLIVTLITFWKGSKINNVEFLKGFITAIILLLTYKIALTVIELSGLIRDLGFYYNTIL